MPEPDVTLFHKHDNEELIQPNVVIPSPTEAFDEVLAEMENKISRLEEYLAKLEGGINPHENVPTPTPTLTGQVRDWITNTQNLPGFMQPFITDEKPVSEQHKTYKIFDISMLNSKHEWTPLYANVVAENVLFGAAGGLGVGYILNSFMPLKSKIKNINSVKADSFRKSIAYMGVAQRVAKKAVIAGFLYDFLKRNMAQTTGNIHWSQSIYSAAMCGAILGLKGGPKKCILSAAGFSVSAFIWERCPTLHSVT